MGTFDTQTPKRLQLAEWEKASRRTAVAATGSAAPAEYAPIVPPSPIYTHVGHAAQYGRGRRNGRSVRLLILHVTDVNGTLLGAMSFEARRGGKNPTTGAPTDMVSCHGFAGPLGELGACVPYTDRAFTTGRWNDESLTLEIIGHDEWTAAQWRARPEQMEAIVVWLVDGCRRFGIPPRWLWRADIAKGASRHGQTPVQGTEFGICDHLEANNAARDLGQTSGLSHVCVGPGLRTVLFEDLLPEVVRRLTPAPPPVEPPPVVVPPVPPVTTEAPNVFTYSPAGYANAFLIGAGPAIQLDGPAFAQCQALKVPHVRATEPHPQMLRSILHQSGLTEADLVKIS